MNGETCFEGEGVEEGKATIKASDSMSRRGIDDANESDEETHFILEDIFHYRNVSVDA